LHSINKKISIYLLELKEKKMSSIALKKRKTKKRNFIKRMKITFRVGIDLSEFTALKGVWENK
jgi:hypothetical protein